MLLYARNVTWIIIMPSNKLEILTLLSFHLINQLYFRVTVIVKRWERERQKERKYLNTDKHLEMGWGDFGEDSMMIG